MYRMPPSIVPNHHRFPTLFASALAVPAMALSGLLLTGCGVVAAPSSVPQVAPAAQGSVYGGQQPVAASVIQLYAVGTTGDGSDATPLLLLPVTSSDGSGDATNANANAGNGFNSFPAGSFTLTGNYTCPSASTQVYLTATNGNPGLPAGTNNTAIAELAFLGQCGDLSASTYISINELTTVGSLAGLAPYTRDYASIGSGASDAAQFLAALQRVAAYTNTATGTVPGPGLEPGYYASTLEVTTLADILAACINSYGTGGVCPQLFALTTLPGNSPPTNTVAALGNILRNPGQNVPAIFNLLPAVNPFQPTLNAAPASWSLPILPLAATPEILPASGYYRVAPTVTLSDATPGTAIYYTTDGTTPTASSALYAGPFTLTNTGSVSRMVRAIATASGFAASAAASATYTLPAAGAASAVGFLSQPLSSVVSTTLPAFRVGIVDPYGTPVAVSGKPIVLSIGNNPGGGTLRGTTAAFTVADGSVTFSDLTLNKVGSGYTLNAVANGYAGTVSAAFDITAPPIVFTLPGTLIGAGTTLPGTFTLPTAAPSGGTTVNLTSSNTAAITISPAAVTLKAGDTTGSFTYTSVGAGSTTLRASAATYTDGTASETTTSTAISLGTLPSLTLGTSQNLALTLTQPAPAGGLTVALGSSNSSVVTVTPSVSFAGGSTTPSVTPQILGKAFGTATITATASGYAPDARSVTLSATTSLTQDIAIARGYSVMATLSLSQAPSSSLVFTLKSDNTAVATIPGTVTLPSGQTSVTFSVYGSGVGSTTIRASASGVSDVTSSVNVTGSASILNGSPAAMLYTPATLALNSAAAPVSITLTSSNPGVLLLSSDPALPGTASITLTNVTGASATFYEQGQTQGTSMLTLSSTSYATVTSQVTVYGSTVLVQPGFPSPISSLANPATVYVTLGEVSGTAFIGPCVGYAASGVNSASLGCRLNPGVSISVPVLSATTATGTITSSPVVLAAGTQAATTTFQPVAAGTSVISVGTQPTGFTVPSGNPYTAFIATVAQPTFTLSNAGVYAPGVTTPVRLILPFTDTSTDGATVTVASGNGSLAVLSTDPDVLGSATLTLPGIHATLPTIYVQGLAAGSTTLTVSAPGYATNSSALNVTSGGVGFTSSSSISLNTSDAPYIVTLILNIGPGKSCYINAVTYCFLNPGTTLQIPMTTYDPNILTISSAITLPAGTAVATGTISGVGAGNTVLQIGTVPAPLAQPASGYGVSQVAVFVQQSRIASQALITGVNFYIGQNAVLTPPPGSARTITFTSSNPAVVVVSTNAAVLGSGSASLTNYSSGVAPYYVQGLSAGTSTLTISAQGYTSSSATITVLPSGIVFSGTNPATLSTTSFSSPTVVGVTAALLNPSTLAVATYCGPTTCLPNPGVSLSIPVSSTNLTAGTVSASPVVFAAGAYTASFTFIPNEIGRTTLTLGQQPTGLTSAAGTANAATVTVTGSQISVGNVTTGAGLYVSEAMSLGSDPPAPTTVTVTLLDPSLARLSTDPAVLGTGSTLSFPNVSCLDTYCANGHGPPLFYVQGMAAGYTKLLVTVRGYGTGVANVAVYKAGLTLFGLGTQYVTGTIGSTNPVNASGLLSLLDPYSLSHVSDCTLGANPCTVNPGAASPAFSLTTANPAIGVFPGPSTAYSNTTGFSMLQYTPLTPGQTTYSLATQASGYYNTTTQERKTGIASSTVSGNGGQQNALYLLAHDIDAGVGVEVAGSFGYSATVIGYNTNPLTVTVADPTVAVLSTSPTTVGKGAFTGTYTDFSNTFYVQGLKAGTTTVTFAESGYIGRTITVTVRPAGFVIKQFDFSTALTNRVASFTVLPAVLNDAGQWMANAQVNPQGGASVALSSSAAGVATLPASVAFAAGATSATVTAQLVNLGNATFTLGTPSASFTAPTTYQSVTLTVR